MSDSKNIKIIQTVASGGTAVLFKAVQTSLDRIVAVKQLHQHLTDDENFTRRFILEAKAAASLDHPNIVHVIDFGLVEDSYQMVMEFVEGESLKEILERWRPIKYDLALAIVYQICLGLEHAHAKGIVHRDIKPGNVMLTESGMAKITDFGLAKLTQAVHSHTADNSILGTPLYMSPEQAFGESVDQRSDLFSLGTVLYELLSGRQPFASENYMGVIQNIIHKEIPLVTELHSEIPAEVEAIVTRALSKNRDDRFQSAREFREAIEGYLGLLRLNEVMSTLKVLLEKNTNTQVLPSIGIPRPAPRRKKSLTGIAAVVIFLLASVGTVVVMNNPALLDRVAALTGNVTGDGAQRADLVDPETFHFDMKSIIDTDHSVVQDSSAALPVDTAPTSVAQKTQPAETPPVEQPNAAEPKPQPKAHVEPAPKPQVVRKGFLSVTASPSAEVYVDGVYQGDTPPPLKLKLTAGKHAVEMRHPRHETYREQLRIIAGELSRRNVTLKKLRGIVSLATQEGAEFYVDGVLFGMTPIRKPIELDAGRHALSIKKQGFFTWTSEVTIEPNKTLPLKITLSRQY